MPNIDKAESLHHIFLDCLRTDKDNEKHDEDEESHETAVLISGVVEMYSINPASLDYHALTVRDIAKAIVSDDFIHGKGGGMSFLNLCIDRNGYQWGEHQNCEELVVLCIALGYAKYTISKSMWDMLPGGMPYVEFNFHPKKEA